MTIEQEMLKIHKLKRKAYASYVKRIEKLDKEIEFIKSQCKHELKQLLLGTPYDGPNSVCRDCGKEL